MKNRLARDFERRAKEQAKSAETLFEAVDFVTDVKKQALFVVGKVTSNLFVAMAELAAYLGAADKLDEMDILRKEAMEKSNAIRTAAARGSATGNWDEFDRLAGFTESGSPEGD